MAGASGSIAVTLDYQAHVTCTFVATAQPATVTIRQVVAGQTPVIDWEFAGDFGAFSLPAAGGETQEHLQETRVTDLHESPPLGGVSTPSLDRRFAVAGRRTGRQYGRVA